MNFSEKPPSTDWSALVYRGQEFAEVWFKPEGNPFALTVRIPPTSFQIPGLGQRLTMENMLKAVGVTIEEVESWRVGDELRFATGESGFDLKRPLSPPPQDVPYLNLHVSLKQPQAVAPNDGRVPEVNEATWLFLEDRWNLILGLEASIENLRISMEGLRSEMEGAARKTLPLDVKVNAVSSDTVQWDRAKSRIRFAVPKLREFVHRATWAMGAAERKKLADLYDNHVKPRIPAPQIEELMAQFEGLLKERQALYAQGTTASQDCKRILAECQSALRLLENNAAANARRKKR